MSGRATRRPASAAGVVKGGLMAVVFVAITVPIGWMVLTAFKQPSDVYRLTLLFRPTLDNFRLVFGAEWNVGRLALNSLVVATVTVAIAIPVAVCAAYVFSRQQFRGREALFQLILITQFVPAVVIVLPFYLLFRHLGLLDTYAGLIMVDLGIVLPYAVWTVKGFIDAVPTETEEAASIDGAGVLRTLWAVVVPMAWPGILTTAIFCFILTWNEFLFALVLTRSDAVTLPVGLMGFRTERGDLWQLIAATGIVITIPMFGLSLIVQRHFTQGLTLGSGK